MLIRKMIRDMLENKLAYVACIVVMAMGLMTYSSMSIVMENLLNAKESFYTQYRMADAFAQVQSYPQNQLSEFEKIPGILKADGVIKQDFRVQMKDEVQSVYLRVNSYDIHESDRLNDVYLSDGYDLTEDDFLIWIGQKFYEANDLKISDKLDLIISGKLYTFTVAGVVQSPEYVYATRNQADFYPDPKTFDIAYVSEDLIEKLLSKTGQVNYLSFDFEEGTSYDDVKPIIESKLKSHGLISLVELKNQTSNFMLSNELEQLVNSAQSMPILFLSISSFILYIMLKRLTEMQRGQIGILKAMGYSNFQIMLHYLGYATTIGILGGVVGGILGTQLSISFTEMYKTFFTFPTLKNEYTYKYFAYGILISLFFSTFAGVQGSKKVLKLTPSMAMSPESPKVVKRSHIEHIKVIWESLTMQGRMAVRNISRSKGRSAFTVLGLIFAFSILVVAWSYNDLVDTMMFDQFNEVQLYDMKVSFLNVQPADDVINQLYNIDGVEYAEPLIELPIQIKNGQYEKTTVIIGLSEETQLYKVLDNDKHEVDLSQDGLYLSENLASQLQVKVGTILRIESPISDDYILMELVGIIPQYIGSNGYANISYLEDKTGLDNLATTAYLNIDESKQDTIRKELDKSPYVGVVEIQAQTLKKFMDLLDSYGFTNYIMAIISIIVGFAIVYNSSVISLSERQRELASLRVLGMSVDEVLQIVSFEQWLLGFVSIVIGIPVSYAMMQAMATSFQTDVYSFPPIIGDNAFVLSVFGTALFIFLSQINVKRKIKKLDIVEVLKERE